MPFCLCKVCNYAFIAYVQSLQELIFNLAVGANAPNGAERLILVGKLRLVIVAARVCGLEFGF